MTDPILSVARSARRLRRRGHPAGVSIAVPERSIVAIIGPNGSGKSTLLKAIYGLIPVRAGSVSLARQ